MVKQKKNDLTLIKRNIGVWTSDNKNTSFCSQKKKRFRENKNLKGAQKRWSEELVSSLKKQ